MVKRIANDNRDKNEIVYKITQKSRTQGMQRNRNFNGSCLHNFNLKYFNDTNYK